LVCDPVLGQRGIRVAGAWQGKHLSFSGISIQSMGGPISFLFFCFPYLVVAALCLDVCLHGVKSKSTSWSTNPNTSTPFHTQRCRSPQRRDGDGETLGMGAATMQLAAKGSDGAALGERMVTVWLRAKDGNGARAEDGDDA